MTLPDKDSIDTYGGAMANYADVVDPTTDEDAAYRNKYAANVAMMTHTIPRGAFSFLGTTGGATAIADPTSGFVHDAVYGDAAGLKPVGSYVQTGVYTWTLPTQVSDELGGTHVPNVRRAWAEVESSDGTFRDAKAKQIGARQITVYTYESFSGSVLPSQLPNQVVTVFWI